MNKLVLTPNKFHIESITINARNGLHTFEIRMQVRDLMKIYRLMKKRNNNIICNKISQFLNSFALSHNYNNFNVNDNISTAKVGVRDDN